MSIPITIGMISKTNPQITLKENIQKAIRDFRKLYGFSPTVCDINPGMFDETTIKIDGITIQPNQLQLMGQIWIGI